MNEICSTTPLMLDCERDASDSRRFFFSRKLNCVCLFVNKKKCVYVPLPTMIYI